MKLNFIISLFPTVVSIFATFTSVPLGNWSGKYQSMYGTFLITNVWLKSLNWEKIILSRKKS